MDKLKFLKGLDKLAHHLRALGLRPITQKVKQLLSLIVRDITIQVDDLLLIGCINHRDYLISLREGRREAYMAELFRTVIKPGMVVCDIGAYLGYYALLGAQRVGKSGKVFAFEPDPHNYAYLSRNVQANQFQDIIVAVPNAVSNRNGFMNFYVYAGDQSQSSLFQLPERDMTHTFKVECLRLDDFFRGKFTSIDVIKMDIEGGELSALKGMEGIFANSPSMVMFLECNQRALRAAGGSPRELLETLKRLGFVVQVIDEDNMKLKTVATTEIETAKYVNLFCRRCD